jgi:uncharacterized membrane protein
VTLVRYLHLLAMAFFVGGQLFLVVAVVPSLRNEAEGERLRTIARRFGWGTLVAVVAGLVVWHNDARMRACSRPRSSSDRSRSPGSGRR